MNSPKVEFAIKVLKEYADNTGSILQCPSDLSSLEGWLIMKLYKQSKQEVNKLIPSTKISPKLKCWKCGDKITTSETYIRLGKRKYHYRCKPECM